VGRIGVKAMRAPSLSAELVVDDAHGRDRLAARERVRDG
jgi:hypothetical protein